MQHRRTEGVDTLNANVTDIFIITYGRTGSTLLQALLNTAPGVDIEGENYGVLYHLYAAWRALRLARTHLLSDGAGTASHPFFGATRDYRHNMEEQILNAARSFLRRGKEATLVCGFKEVRHDVPDVLDYLAFLIRISERPHFIFLTRAHQDVIASGFMREADPASLLSRLASLESRFADFAASHPAITTHLDYSAIAGQGTALADLFERLGLTCDAERIAAVKAEQHSYGVKSTLVFMGHRLQVSSRAVIDPVFELCRMEAPNHLPGGGVTLTGLLLPRATQVIEALTAGDPSGTRHVNGKLNLPSPGLAKQLPDNGKAATARFSITLPEPDKVQVVTAIVNGRHIEIAAYFPAPQLPQSRLFEPVAQTGTP